jgi:hypothetical protein
LPGTAEASEGAPGLPAASSEAAARTLHDTEGFRIHGTVMKKEARENGERATDTREGRVRPEDEMVKAL